MNDAELGREYLRQADAIRRRVDSLPKCSRLQPMPLEQARREILLRGMMYELRSVGGELCRRGALR